MDRRFAHTGFKLICGIRVNLWQATFCYDRSDFLLILAQMSEDFLDGTPAQRLLILCDLAGKCLEFVPGLLEFCGRLFIAKLEALIQGAVRRV